MTQTQLNIHQVPIFPLGMINAFIIETGKACILVDTGLPDSEDKIKKVLKKLNKSFSDISLIVITHAHVDHAGNAVKLKQLTGAPIIAHEGDLPFYQGKKTMTFCSTGWFGSLFKKTGAINTPYDAFTPDILLSNGEHFDLLPYGVKGKIVPTMGHTDGSISVVLDDSAIVGDLISSGILLGGTCCTHKAKRPPFEDNPNLVSQQLERLVTNGAKKFYMGHGGPLPREEVLRHVKKLRQL